MSRKTKATYLFLYALTILIYGFLLAFGITNINHWRTAKSKEYLHKANIELVEANKMLLLEKATVLNPTEETYLAAGIMSLKLDNNKLAEKYLKRVKTADGYAQLANSYYNLGKFDLAIEKYKQAINIRPDESFYIGLAKSQLKQGNLDASRTAFEKAYGLKKSNETANMLLLLGSRINVSEVTVSVIAKRVGAQETDATNRAILIYNELNRLGYPHSADKVLQEATEKGEVSRDSVFTLALDQISLGSYENAYTLLQQTKGIDPYYPQIYKQLILVCEKLGKADEARQNQDFYSQLVF